MRVTITNNNSVGSDKIPLLRVVVAGDGESIGLGTHLMPGERVDYEVDAGQRVEVSGVVSRFGDAPPRLAAVDKRRDALARLRVALRYAHDQGVLDDVAAVANSFGVVSGFCTAVANSFGVVSGFCTAVDEVEPHSDYKVSPLLLRDRRPPRTSDPTAGCQAADVAGLPAFPVGAVVVMAGEDLGWPPMTVESVTHDLHLPTGDRDRVDCAWFVGGVLQRANFPARVLRLERPRRADGSTR